MASAKAPNKNIKKSSELRAWLESIKAANPRKLLVAGDVAKAARDPKSPGHRQFTWDNSKAAEKYRVIEAERLIRTVYVIDAETGDKSPAFLSLLPDREHPGGGYRSTSEVVSSKALRAQLELTAKAELRAWTERFKMLSGLVGAVAQAAGIAKPARKRN